MMPTSAHLASTGGHSKSSHPTSCSSGIGTHRNRSVHSPIRDVSTFEYRRNRVGLARGGTAARPCVERRRGTPSRGRWGGAAAARDDDGVELCPPTGLPDRVGVPTGELSKLLVSLAGPRSPRSSSSSSSESDAGRESRSSIAAPSVSGVPAGRAAEEGEGAPCARSGRREDWCWWTGRIGVKGWSSGVGSGSAICSRARKRVSSRARS